MGEKSANFVFFVNVFSLLRAIFQMRNFFIGGFLSYEHCTPFKLIFVYIYSVKKKRFQTLKKWNFKIKCI